MESHTAEKIDIRIKAEYLGAIKQIPYLCKAIQRAMPEKKVCIVCWDYSDRKLSYSDLVSKGLKREELSSESIEIRQCGEGATGEGVANLLLDFSTSLEVSYRRKTLSLPIDPLKFERRKTLSKEEVEELREKYAPNTDRVILGGSLRQDEGEPLVRAMAPLLKKKSNTKVLLVPRSWPNDFSKGLDSFFQTAGLENRDKFHVVTESGILEDLYSICDLAFVGDTINRGTGQNPLEPAFYGKPILYGGTYMCNKFAFKGLSRSGLLRATDGLEDLTQAIRNPLAGKELAEAQRKTSEFIDSMQGAADLYAQLIKEVLDTEQLDNKQGRKIEEFLETKYYQWDTAFN
ncbi:MAG: hypothetical protein WCI72_01235 [archaeon]